MRLIWVCCSPFVSIVWLLFCLFSCLIFYIDAPTVITIPVICCQACVNGQCCLQQCCQVVCCVVSSSVSSNNNVCIRIPFPFVLISIQTLWTTCFSFWQNLTGGWQGLKSEDGAVENGISMDQIEPMSLHVQIDGMTCTDCATSVEKRLRNVPGK